jgi:hypothetical protein
MSRPPRRRRLFIIDAEELTHIKQSMLEQIIFYFLTKLVFEQNTSPPKRRRRLFIIDAEERAQAPINSEGSSSHC